MSDILMALDNGDIALLTLLDLSAAAFDTVDHATLLKRLEISYGLKGHLLGWFESYLTGRKQSVRLAERAQMGAGGEPPGPLTLITEYANY